MTREVPQCPVLEEHTREVDRSNRAFLNGVLARMRAGRPPVGLRSPEERGGRVIRMLANSPREGVRRAGSTPTAQDMPWGTGTNADGTFNGTAGLRGIYAHHGLLPERPVVARSCFAFN